MCHSGNATQLDWIEILILMKIMRLIMMEREKREREREQEKIGSETESWEIIWYIKVSYNLVLH